MSGTKASAEPRANDVDIRLISKRCVGSTNSLACEAQRAAIKKAKGRRERGKALAAFMKCKKGK